MVKSVPRPDEPINRVRRRDRAVEDEEWIRSFLRQAGYGVVATESEGQPFINPLIFVYEEESNSVYFHTGRAGRIFANIAKNPRVCFNASRMGKLIPAGKASGFDVEYESVIVFGRAHVLDDEGEALRALRLLLDKYFPELHYGEDYKAIAAGDLRRAAVYRLDIECWSGKRNAARSEAGGA
jgi:nitroimidazol reductase NimA-like FMN-containing flavoprotein (pyridoxamine 5'-phosphate oxidase superfamily)